MIDSSSRGHSGVEAGAAAGRIARESALRHLDVRVGMGENGPAKASAAAAAPAVFACAGCAAGAAGAHNPSARHAAGAGHAANAAGRASARR